MDGLHHVRLDVCLDSRVPETQDTFLDSYHFGDRGSLLIAQAIAETIP